MGSRTRRGYLQFNMSCAEKGHACGGRSSGAEADRGGSRGRVCATSLKAALDRDWDQLGQREEALSLVLQVLRAVETWVQTLPQEEACLAQSELQVAQQIKAQDVETIDLPITSRRWVSTANFL